MRDKQHIWGFFAHTSIIIGMMFVVFFVIDQFNPEMEFLTSTISKWLMLVLSLCAIATGLFSAIFLYQSQKRRDEKRSHAPSRPTHEPEEYAQPRFAQPYYEPRQHPKAQQATGYAAPREYPANQMRQSGSYPREYAQADYERRSSYQG